MTKGVFITAAERNRDTETKQPEYKEQSSKNCSESLEFSGGGGLGVEKSSVSQVFATSISIPM